MVNLHLWLVILENTSVDRAPLRQAHRDYMSSLMDSGVIFASGPTSTSVGDKTTGGATLLRVADEAEARDIMDNEPFVFHGARSYELIAWNIRHADFSTCEG